MVVMRMRIRPHLGTLPYPLTYFRTTIVSLCKLNSVLKREGSVPQMMLDRTAETKMVTGYSLNYGYSGHLLGLWLNMVQQLHTHLAFL